MFNAMGVTSGVMRWMGSSATVHFVLEMSLGQALLFAIPAAVIAALLVTRFTGVIGPG